MSKRRKVVVILGLIALAVVGFFALRPLDEPKYQGRYLSEWMAIYRINYQTSPESEAARKAVQTIGTNGLPYFLKWMRYEVPSWRTSLRRKLPSWLADNRTVERWIDGSGDARLRTGYGCSGVVILGTNALGALPELEAMMRDRTKPRCAQLATTALSNLGEPAVPIFQAALADPHQAGREQILGGIGLMPFVTGPTTKCLPVFVAALTNDDASVRSIATNRLRFIAPKFLTKAPAL